MAAQNLTAHATTTEHPRTKIVCTLGPASSDEATVRGMIQAGMSVARINLSHGKYTQHAQRIELVRRVAADMGRVVAILGDLQGPKIRIGKIESEPMLLERDSQVVFTSKPNGHELNVIPLPQPEVIEGVAVGSTVWLDDGLLELLVVDKAPGELRCQVVVGGPLLSRKGISAAGARVAIPAITSKDRKDLAFAVEQQVDFIAMSFVRSADDIQALRELIQLHSARIPIIAKIERPEALENLNEIVEVSDAVMVARGDLGVEAVFEEVPAYQKQIIRACNQAACPVITATQMLHTMTTASHPTRAEANDVFTSVLQGTDALMLSGESAVGNHPVRAVEVMARIARMAEQHFPHDAWSIAPSSNGQRAVTEGIAQATCQLASYLGARAIITNTMSGQTTRQVARHRPQAAIISTTPSDETHCGMSLVWGVQSLLVPRFASTDEMVAGVKQAAVEAGLLQMGDVVVIAAGAPVGQEGLTNGLQVHRIGSHLLEEMFLPAHVSVQSGEVMTNLCWPQ